MDEKEIMTSWWRILKALPFDNGPSSTRWVYLLSASVVALSVVMMSAAFCWVYIAKDHVASAVVAGAIAATITALFGFAARSQNVKNRLTADAPEDSSAPPPAP